MQNIVIAGAGKLGERHLRAYASIGNANVIGIVEPDEDRRTALIDEFHGISAYDALEDATDDPAVDVIDVCSPTVHHFDQVSSSLLKGKSVFCEKPLVTDLRQAERLEAIVAESPGDLRVGYVYRHHPRMQRLKSLVDTDTLGQPLLAMLRIGGRGSHRAWKHRSAEGGGVLLDMASHMIDLALWLFGSIEDSEMLLGTQLMHKREIDGAIVDTDAEDLAVLRLRSVGDVEILIHADFVSPGFAHSVEVAGTNGSAMTSILTSIPDRYTLLRPAGGLPSGETVFPGESSDMLRRQLEAFLHELETEGLSSDMSASLEIARVFDRCRG